MARQNKINNNWPTFTKIPFKSYKLLPCVLHMWCVLRSAIICCSHRVAVWGPQTLMSMTSTRTGDDGHPIPASLASGVDKLWITANLCSTGTNAEILSYTLQNPQCGYQVFSTKCFILQTSSQPMAVFHKGHSLEQQAATGSAPKNRTTLGTQYWPSATLVAVPSRLVTGIILFLARKI